MTSSVPSRRRTCPFLTRPVELSTPIALIPDQRYAHADGPVPSFRSGFLAARVGTHSPPPPPLAPFQDSRVCDAWVHYRHRVGRGIDSWYALIIPPVCSRARQGNFERDHTFSKEEGRLLFYCTTTTTRHHTTHPTRRRMRGRAKVLFERECGAGDGSGRWESQRTSGGAPIEFPIYN